MTNFLAELFELTEDVPTPRKPLAVLLLIVFIVPAMLFGLLIELMDWMLQWTWEGLKKTGAVLILLGFSMFGLFMFFDALPSGDLVDILIGLICFAVWVYNSLSVIGEWRSG